MYFHFLSRCLRTVLLCLALATGLATCARLGPRVQPVDLPPGAPEAKDVLASLAASESALTGFSARGTLILKAPDRAAIRMLPHSDVLFQRPASLYVAGRKYAHTAFRLYCQDKRFLIVMPLDQQYYYRQSGEALEYYGPQASPADIAREMFVPEAWAQVSPRLSRVTAFHREARQLELEVYRDEAAPSLKRWLRVEGPPWVILESKLYDRAGQVLAWTRKSDYRQHGEVRIPAELQTDFPLSDAWMRYEMGRVNVNESIPPEKFEVSIHLREARGKGYAEVESYQ